MTHPNFIKIDACDTDGTHKFDEIKCPNCGTVFCYNCRANSNDHRDPDYMICPGCGQNSDQYDEDSVVADTTDDQIDPDLDTDIDDIDFDDEVTDIIDDQDEEGENRMSDDE